MENSMVITQKVNMVLPYYPEIPLLGIYLEELKSVLHRDICTPMFTAALFTTAKVWKQPKCPPMEKKM